MKTNKAELSFIKIEIRSKWPTDLKSDHKTHRYEVNSLFNASENHKLSNYNKNILL